ncbi:PAS domain-containing protein [Aestuariivirga sp.]|uniref:PAS domain-containing sensor histidine kinase n=1 Tax=Aestuariivirga sp. TaxID=2650926 RepID=UPI00391B7313
MPYQSFLQNGGETAALIRSRDWSGTPLGSLQRWPQSLRTTLSILLHSTVPMVLLWGEEGVMLYNDAYSVFAGGRHPKLLGSKVREGWPEVADFNDHVMKTGLAGQTLVFRDQELTLYRSERPEQVWMNLDYSPVYDESGRPAGVLALVVETTDRVLAERKLASEHRRLREMVEQAPGIVAMFEGPEHRYVLANAAHRKLIGREDVVGRTARQAHPELEGQGFFELMDRVYETGEAYHGKGVPVRLARPGDELQERLLNFIYQPIRNEQGAVTGIFVEGFDVTEERREMERRTKAEAVLRERERELQEVADAIPALVSYMNRDLRYQFVNKLYEEWFGRRREDIQGKQVREIVGEKAFARALPFFERALKGERITTELDMPYPEGARHIRVDYVPRLNEARDVIGVYALVEDITTAKRAELALRASEARLRESEERLRLASEAAGLGAHEYDIASGTVTWSSGLQRLAGRALTTLTMAQAQLSTHPADRARIAGEMAEVMTRVGPYELEFRLQRPDGETIWVLDRGEAFGPIDPANGRVARIMGNLIDITERKRAEERIRMLMREVNHRSKNLLAVVQVVAKQTAGRGDLETFASRFTERLQGLAASHDLLVHNSWQGVSFPALVRSQLAHLSDLIGRRILTTGPDIWVKPSAAQALGMALHELATNASKYGALSSEGGKVEIAWKIVPSAEGERFHLIWREGGGPAPRRPVRQGFGSILLKTMTEMTFGGSVTNDFLPEGLSWSLTAPVDQVSWEPELA